MLCGAPHREVLARRGHRHPEGRPRPGLIERLLRRGRTHVLSLQLQ